MKSAEETTRTIYIYNSIGNLMFHSAFINSDAVNTSSWPAGIYFVRRGSITIKVVLAR
ncbi:MAG: T9SS type A sorting domain-containing protein [Saprospiraceae bacterium]